LIEDPLSTAVKLSGAVAFKNGIWMLRTELALLSPRAVTAKILKETTAPGFALGAVALST
jgi:hypothetical protein